MTNNATIKEGDTVKLKSGSPLMTVKATRSTADPGKAMLADVDWFDVQGQPHNGQYLLTSLRKVSSK
jgi:uncharacterized protein YodC (DUF2158 family)